MKILLREIARNGNITDHALNGLVPIQVTEGSSYSLIHSETQQAIQGVNLRRLGENLELVVEGEPVAQVADFYSNGASATFSDGSSVLSTSVEAGEVAWSAESVAGEMPVGESVGQSLAGSGSAAVGGGASNIALAGLGAVGLGGAAGGFGGSSSSDPLGTSSSAPAPNIVQETTAEESASPDSAEVNPASASSGSTTVSSSLEAAGGNAATETSSAVSVPFEDRDLIVGQISISNDTGTSDDDFITNTPVQTITGILSAELEPGGSLHASVGAGFVDITSSVSGTTFSWSTTLISNPIQFYVRDASGNPGPLISRPYTLDQTGPTTTVSGIEISDDDGPSDTDFDTGVAAQEITATLSAELTWGEILYGSVDGGSTWSDITSSATGTGISWFTSLNSGSSSIQFKVVDRAGNNGVIASQGYSLGSDTTPPTVTIDSATDNVGSVTGALSSGDTTDDTSVALSGTTEAGATVEIFDGTTLLGGATVTGTNWTFTAPVVNGTTHNFNAVATDASSNSSAPTANFVITGDTTAPTVTIDSAADDVGSLTGALSSGDTTDDTAVLLSGTTEAGATVEIFDGLASLGFATVTGTSWTFSATVVDGTTHNFNAVATDAAGNSSAPTANFVITGDTTAPTVSLDLATDDFGVVTGVLSDGDESDDPSITLTGSVDDPNAVVEIYDGMSFLGTASVTGTFWHYDATLSDGFTYDFNVVAIDEAGNASMPTPDFQVVSDQSLIITSVEVNADGLLEVTFGEDTSNLIIAASDFQIDVNGLTINFSGVSLSGNVATLTPDISDETPAQRIYLEDTVDNFTSSTLDNAGNSVTLPIPAVANNSLGTRQEIFAAVTTIPSEDIYQTGSSFHDLLSVDVNQGGTATISRLDIMQSGGDGSDLLAVSLNATVSESSADALVGGSTESGEANSIHLLGGDGADTLDIDLIARAMNTYSSSFESVTAVVRSNEIYATGEHIDVKLLAEATNGSYNYAQLSSNDIYAVGETVDVYLDATAAGNSVSIAQIFGNDVTVLGGGDSDQLGVYLNAGGVIGSEGTAAMIRDNFVRLEGLSGNDTLWVKATAVSVATQDVIRSNAFILVGGAGTDTINITANAGRMRDNLFLLRGREGADVFNFSTNAAVESGNYYSFYYGSTGHLGDDINGLALGSGDELALNFYHTAFNFTTTEGHLNSAQFFQGADPVATATGDRYFLYDTNDHILYYDADGSGTGDSPVVVADFDAFPGAIDAGNINLVGNTMFTTSDSSFNAPFSDPYFQIGASENDVLALKVTDFAIFATVNNHYVTQFADKGNDILAASFVADATGSSAGANVANNNLNQEAGEGTDNIGALFEAKASASGFSASAYVSNNDVEQSGESGEDTLVAQYRAVATGAGDNGGYFAKARVVNNDVEIDGGDGNDNIFATTTTIPTPTGFGVLLSASAKSAQTALANYVGTNGQGTNHVTIFGGRGTDTIDLDFRANASAGRIAVAYQYNNFFNVYMGEDSGGVYGTAGTEIAKVGLEALAVVDASSNSFADADAVLEQNSGNIYGASGDDNLSLDLLAQASAIAGSTYASTSTANANASILNNQFSIYGGSGNDTIDVNLVADAQATVNGFANAFAAEVISFNTFYLYGGTGTDTLNIALDAQAAANNQFYLRGEQGADIYNLDFAAVGTVSYNDIFIDYAGTDEFGDTLNGFASAFSGGSSGLDAQFRFIGSDFSTLVYSTTKFGSGGTLASATAGQIFFYDTLSHVLYYDSDGFGGGAIEKVVANFDTDVSIDALDITLVP